MQNICIYTLGRSGSNYLRSLLYQPEYFLLNEPFSLSSRYNAGEFLEIIASLFNKNKINFVTMQTIIDITMQMAANQTLIKTTILDDNLLKICLQHIQETQHTNVMWKFMAWYHTILGVNICNLFDSIDLLILNYRKNILKTWISSIKATTTGEWITEKESKNKDIKIIWNKKAYLYFVEYIEKHHLLMKTNFDKYDKPKAIVCYENLSDISTSPKKYLYNKFIAANIDMPLNDSVSIKKQSDDSIAIEDNFSNKQEFLDDYDAITNKIFTSVVFESV